MLLYKRDICCVFLEQVVLLYSRDIVYCVCLEQVVLEYSRDLVCCVYLEQEICFTVEMCDVCVWRC